MQAASEATLDHGIRQLYIVGDGEVVGRGKHRRERGRWDNGKDLGLLNQIGTEQESPDLPGRGTSSVGFRERRKADKIANEVKRFGYPPFVRKYFPPLCFEMIEMWHHSGITADLWLFSFFSGSYLDVSAECILMRAHSTPGSSFRT